MITRGMGQDTSIPPLEPGYTRSIVDGTVVDTPIGRPYGTSSITWIGGASDDSGGGGNGIPAGTAGGGGGATGCVFNLFNPQSWFCGVGGGTPGASGTGIGNCIAAFGGGSLATTICNNLGLVILAGGGLMILLATDRRRRRR